MDREPDKLRQGVNNAIAKRDGDNLVESIHMASPWLSPKDFFTFRYSSTEIFSEGGNLHVRLRETRYEDGRLKSEECEGTLDRQAYHQVMSEAQGFFLNQVATFARLLFAPLVSPPRNRRHDE